MTGRPAGRGLGRKALPLVLVIFGMGGMAWAAVPLYNWFCRVTGFGGTTQVATEGTDRVLDQTIVVRFDASTGRDMPWRFRPLQNSMTVRIGETAIAYYEAYNPADRVITGTASYNVSPFSMGGYFSKIECFCFTEQTLEPGERVEMPVTFYVDPEMVEDAETEGVKVVTLSYTMYEKEPERQATIAGPGKSKNR